MPALFINVGIFSISIMIERNYARTTFNGFEWYYIAYTL